MTLHRVKRKLGLMMKETKSKAIVVSMVTLLFASMLVALVLSTAMVSSENPEVIVSHDRTKIYTTVFEDSVSNIKLEGIHHRSYYLRPQGGAEVDNARIVMETPYPIEFFPSIDSPDTHHPSADFTYSTDGIYSYEWAFHDPIPGGGQAAVWLELPNFPVKFKPGFDYQRNIYPVCIESDSAEQTVTIEFTPYIYFYHAHIYVLFGNTLEASVTVVPGSASDDWLVNEGTGNSVDWGWSIPKEEFVPGITYTFSVELNVVNERYPESIYYKPGVGSGAFVRDKWTDYGTTESVTIEDDVIDGSVTYSGVGPSEQLYHWDAVIQDEHTIRFPSYSGLREPVPPIYKGTFDTWFSNAQNEKIVESAWEVIYKDSKTSFEAEYTELNIWEDLPPGEPPPETPGTYDSFRIEMEADIVTPTDNGYEIRGTSYWWKNGILAYEFYTEIVINEDSLPQQFWMQIYVEGEPVGWITGSLIP